MSTPQVGSPVNAFPNGPGSGSCGDCEVPGIPAADLLEIALAPESMTSDNQSYTERSVDDLIKLDQYLKAKCAAATTPNAGGWGQVRLNKATMPDATGYNE